MKKILPYISLLVISIGFSVHFGGHVPHTLFDLIAAFLGITYAIRVRS